MTKNVKPVSFAEEFKIDENKLTELGIFNPILNFDSKLFVEPLLLKNSSSPIIREAHNTYNQFFKDTLVLLKASKEIGDKPWRELKRRVHFPEYGETCIGYGDDTIRGKGSGKYLSNKILQSAKEIVDLAYHDPEIFLLLPLLEEGIGADLISDMTQKIINDDICKYTVDCMQKLNLKGMQYENGYLLPWNPYHKCKIKLLPTDILSNLPMIDNFGNWIDGMAGMNLQLRELINKQVGSNFYEANKAERKETVLTLIKNDKEFFFKVLEVLKEADLDHYDIEKDYQGLRRWFEDSKIFLRSKPFEKINSVAEKQEALLEAVEEIIMQFKEIIEDQDLWRVFWTEHDLKFKHVNELYSQMLFFMVSDTWLTAQDSNIKVERYFNQETKQIDFVFIISKKCQVTVNIKHANNFSGLEKGYDRQLKQSKVSKTKNSFYVVMNFDDKQSTQLKRILNNEKEDCKIIQIHSCLAGGKQSTLNFDDDFNWFGDLGTSSKQYFQEKSNAGKQSYQRNKAIKSKVQELCKIELESRKYHSASQLCNVIANIMVSNYSDLLNVFLPYQNHELEGNDWRQPTFYKWCNEIFKTHLSQFIIS